MTSKPRALVTGTSGGLGKALADRLLADNWEVVAVDHSARRDKVDDRIDLTHDLSDRKSVEDLLSRLESEAGFDLVIHNAGASATGRFENIPPENHLKLIRLNAETPMVLTARLAAMGKFNTGARLAFISSLSHFTGYPGAASYAASKDAIAVYAKSIRKPFGRRGIKVSCVFPGPMRTDQAERHSPDGAHAERRMPAEFAAELVLRDLAKGKARIIPGGGPRLFSILGKIAPWASDRVMRRILFEKLDRDVF